MVSEQNACGGSLFRSLVAEGERGRGGRPVWIGEQTARKDDPRKGGFQLPASPQQQSSGHRTLSVVYFHVLVLSVCCSSFSCSNSKATHRLGVVSASDERVRKTTGEVKHEVKG